MKNIEGANFWKTQETFEDNRGKHEEIWKNKKKI